MPDLPPIATVNGHVDPAAAELAEVFSRGLTRSRGGAQFTLIVNGATVLDVNGGTIQGDTPVQVFSVSKLITALAAAHAHETGALDLDQTISSYWPGMKKTSTKDITARMILEHSSGLAALDRPLTTDEFVAGAMDSEIEKQEPYWKPGADHGYHAFTFGPLMNGVFRHALGIPVSAYVRQHFTAPTGHDFWFGAPADMVGRVAPLSFDFPILTAAHGEAIMSGRAINDGSMAPVFAGAPFFFGDPRVIQMDVPSLTGITSASDVAHLVAKVTGISSANGILSRSTVSNLAAERRRGMDRTLYHVSRFGSGVELPHVYGPMLGGASFGHQGAGGAIVVLDPERDVVFSYVCTHTPPSVGTSDAALTLLGAVNEWLASR